MGKGLSAAYHASDKIYVIAVDAADMRAKQAAQKTRHLWNGPSCYLN